MYRLYNSQCGCPFSREKYEVYPGQCFFFCTAHARGHIWHWARNEISRIHNRYQATLKISNQRYCTKRNIEIMFLLFSWDKDIERKSWVRSGCQISGRCIFICFVLCICYLANFWLWPIFFPLFTDFDHHHQLY